MMTTVGELNWKQLAISIYRGLNTYEAMGSVSACVM